MKSVLIAARNINRSTGTGRTILEHARLLKESGWQPIIVGEALDLQALKADHTQFFRTIKISITKSLKRRLFSWQVDRIARRHDADLVWGHGDNLNQDILSLHNCVHLAEETLRPLMNSKLGSVAALHRKQLAEGRFKTLIANSNLMKQDVQQRFGVSPSKITVINPGYDPAQFNMNEREQNRRQLRQQWGIDQDAPLLGLITSGDLIKRNVSGCLQAFRSVLEQHPRATLIVVGKQDKSAILRAEANSLGIGSSINIESPRPDIEKIYHALDLCLHPAHIEEFGQVVQEAVMCGTPVLTNTMVGAADLYPREANDLLLSSRNSTLLAARVNQLLAEPARTKIAWQKVHDTMKLNTWDFNWQQSFKVLEDCSQEKQRS